MSDERSAHLYVRLAPAGKDGHRLEHQVVPHGDPPPGAGWALVQHWHPDALAATLSPFAAAIFYALLEGYRTSDPRGRDLNKRLNNDYIATIRYCIDAADELARQVVAWEKENR